MKRTEAVRILHDIAENATLAAEFVEANKDDDAAGCAIAAHASLQLLVGKLVHGDLS